MSQIYSYYLRAKQKYNQKSLFVWFSADSDKKAQNKLPYLMDEAGINEEYFFKPIRTNLPVVDELPPEGVFDSEFPQRFTHDANTNDWFPANSNDDQSQTEETASTDSSSISFWKLPTEQRVALVDMYNISDKEPIEAEHVARVRDMLNAEGELHPGNYNRAIGMGKVEAISGMNTMGIRKMLDQIRKHFNGRTPKWPDITNFVRKQLSQISLNKGDDIEQSKPSTQENSEPHISGSYAALDMNVMLSIMNVRPQQAKAADVRTAKEFIDKRDGTWRTISSVLRVIVGICDVETDVIFNITQEALKNLEMVQDRSALLSFMKDKLAGNPACPELAEPQSDTSKLFDESPLAQKLYEGKNDAEEEQSSSSVENEPATTETVAPDTNEHTQEPQALETQSPVEADYQKKRAELHEARKNIPPKNAPVSENAANDDANTAEEAAPQNEPTFIVIENITSGIYYDISNEAYHSGPGVSKSQLDDIADSPALYLWKKNAPIDTSKTKTLDMGTAFHCKALEPEEFNKRFIIAPEFNRRTNAGKEEEKAFLASCANSGKTVMTAEDGKKLELMYDSVMALPLGKWLLESIGHAESSIYWEDPETELLCRCRPDKIIPEYHWIVDVKTTADIRRFKTAYYDYRYHVQDAFYSDGYKEQFGEMPTFVFLVISTTAECGRYPVDIFMMGDDAKQAGRMEYHNNLQTLSECLRNDEWPTIKTLTLPRWAKENAHV